MAAAEFIKVTKQYGKQEALHEVSLDIEKGKILGLLGPNGSGKTTLIKLANGLLRPTSGQVLIDGKAPSAVSKAVSAYLPDRDFLPLNRTVEQAMKMYGDFFADFAEAKAGEILKDLGIRFDQRLQDMSKGTREKTQLCFVMSRQAQIYWLDEPIGGVDPATRDYILRKIVGSYSKDAAMVISTHLIADVEPLLDDVVFLKDGSIVLHQEAEAIREEKQASVEEVFKEVFKC